MKKSLYVIVILLLGCKDRHSQNKAYTKERLFEVVNKDSLIYDVVENSYFDKFGDSSGSLYKFNKDEELIFYCFMNGNVYPYAEYFDKKGGIKKIEGHPSIQVRYRINPDKSYRFSFLFSTFRKSNYKIRTITNFNDTLSNDLISATGFSNVGFFNIVVRTYSDAVRTSLINQVSYFDSIRNSNYSFSDTLNLRDIVTIDEGNVSN